MIIDLSLDSGDSIMVWTTVGEEAVESKREERERRISSISFVLGQRREEETRSVH